MSKIKKINRNAFNEKLIHRYLFERYYFGLPKIKKELLPKKFHNKQINLIAPEEAVSDRGYRADLTLYFRGEKQGVPVEVKWSEQGLNKKNQIEYLKNNNGFVVSFGDTEAIDDIPHIQINQNDFMAWMQESVSKLTRESLTYQAKSEQVNVGNQFWLVFLRGTSHQNFNRMLENSANAPFWAYKQNAQALRNMLDIQKGDSCLFILGSAREGMGVSANPQLPFEVKSWYATKIKEPYYMVLDGPKGTFFEAGDIPINERRWPHFVDFEILESFEGDETISIGKRGEYAKVLADSVNYGAGAPAPLLRRQWDSLTDKLRKSTK